MEIVRNERNFTIIEHESNLYMFSYNSKIAIYSKAGASLTLGRKWNYSQTTLKQLKLFMNELTCFKYETKQQVENDIKSGKIYQSNEW